MATLCRYLLEFYEEIIQKQTDPRVDRLPLMSSPIPVASITIFYYYFICKWGPQLMKSRKPFELKYVMIVYDIIQIIINGYLFFMGVKIPYIQLGYSLICQPVDYSDEPIPRFIVLNVWLYFCVKVLDLLDTVFMVLRKKNNQISFLHVYHHAGMVVGTWIGTKYVAGGQAILVGVINAFVHVVMYFYYLLTAINPEYKKSIWWKKHLTELQMVQFLLLACNSGVVIFNPNCTFPKLFMGLFFPQSMFMFAMFWDFYRKNYLSKKNDKLEKALDNKAELNKKMDETKDSSKITDESCSIKEKKN